MIVIIYTGQMIYTHGSIGSINFLFHVQYIRNQTNQAIKLPISRMQMIPGLDSTPDKPILQLGDIPRQMRTMRMMILIPRDILMVTLIHKRSVLTIPTTPMTTKAIHTRKTKEN